MRLKSQYVFVIGVVGVLVLYFLIRALFGGAHGPNPAAAKPRDAGATPSVQVKLIPEEVREYDVVLRGRTQATRSVLVKSETSGVVAEAPVLQGTMVPKGAVLCRLAVDARQASLDQARANFKSMQLQQQANAELAKKGYRSPTQVLTAQAGADQAQAVVRAAEIALKQVEIRAPFAGVFDHRDAEIGGYLSPGQSCGMMIELSPLLVVGDVPETEAAKLHVGAPASAILVDGGKLSGRVRYVAHDADPATRTYHLEIVSPNPSLAVRSGLSADVRVAAGSGPAHLVPVSALVLDAAGRQGVRYVNASERVAFAPVKILEEIPGGVWVSGLAGPVRLIVVGQSYVADGQQVRVAAAR
jgi:multidrug efflux system membrane fusion protein